MAGRARDDPCSPLRQVLRNLEPGGHTISAYLANGDHEEFEDGGKVSITVSE